MHQPLVSVIMNCYNSDLFLKEAIDSVYAQTYENWEIVFLDNASTDNSADIAKLYDKKLRYFRLPQTIPLYAARNKAVKKCSGHLVAFLDCDDLWIENKLELQIQKANAGSPIVYGDFDTIDENGRTLSSSFVKLKSGRITNSLFRRNPISIGSVLVRKDLLDSEQFDASYELLGDYDMWVRLSFNYPFATVNAVVEHSRRHSGNITNTKADQWIIEQRHLYKKLLRFSNIRYFPMILFYSVKAEVVELIRKNNA